MVWHIKKTSMMGAGVGTVYYKVINVGQKPMQIVLHIHLRQKQKQKITSGRRKQPQVGMLLQ